MDVEAIYKSLLPTPPQQRQTVAGQAAAGVLDTMYGGGQGQRSTPISETTEKTTEGQTFAGVHAQTGQPITVTEKEIIMAARERFPNVNIEIAIAKVKQELGLK